MRQDIEALRQLAGIAVQGSADEQTLAQAASIIRRATGVAEAMVVYAENEDFLVCTDAGNGTATDFTQTALWIVQRQITGLGGPVAFNLIGHRVEDFTSAFSDEQPEFLALSLPTSEGASEMCILRVAPEHKDWATILRFMEAATPALTIVLERFLNIGQRRRYGEKLSVLANAAQLLAQSENLEAALTDLATAIAASTASDYVSIDVYDADSERFVLRALSQSRFAGLSVTQAWIDLLNPDRPEPRNQEVMRTRQPYLSPDVQNDEREPEAVRRYCEATLISSMATFPMLFQDELLGTAAFVYYAPHTFPPDEISFLQGFVTQAATALKALQMHNELQRYAHELKRSADEYIATTNMTGDIIVRLDEHGKWLLLNDAACQFFGRPRDELLGAQSTDYVHPEDVASTTQAIRETRARKGLVRGFLHRFLTAMGPRVVEWDAWPLFDEQGQYTGTQITGRDITERKQMEDALAAKTKEYIDTTNLTGDVIVKVAEDGRVTLLNDAACEFFGKTREELLGVKYADYVHPDDIEPTVRTVVESAVEKELVRSFVNRMLTPMGARVVEWNG
jgi:PAS domain S-box-containing protein